MNVLSSSQVRESTGSGLRGWMRRMSLNLTLRKVCFDRNRETLAGYQTGNLWVLRKIDHCLWGWIEVTIPQPWRKPGYGSRQWQEPESLVAIRTARRKGETEPVSQEATLGFLFTGIWKKAPPDHASKLSGASTAFLRAVPPQRQERLTLKAIKYLGYFRITSWPPGISY